VREIRELPDSPSAAIADRLCAKEGDAGVKVRDLMSRPALAVPAELPIRDVALFLTRHRISGAPVVDRDGRVLGVVSESDIVDKERGLEREQGFLHRVGARARRARATTAAEAMTAPPVVCAPTLSDHGAAWLLSEHDVDRLPVVDRGELVGVVSRTDLTREFTRPDTEIAADIRSAVLDALPAPEVRLEVREGRAQLDGFVESERDRRCLPHAVSQVPGVVTVDSHVCARRAATTHHSRKKGA